MRIDKLEQMVYALDLLIERFKGREQNPRTFYYLLRKELNDVIMKYIGKYEPRRLNHGENDY